jgi:hypothetical protein
MTLQAVRLGAGAGCTISVAYELIDVDQGDGGFSCDPSPGRYCHFGRM